MRETTGVVKNGIIKLPSSVQLPEGLAVKIIWDDDISPYEQEALTEEDINKELEWVTGERFPRDLKSRDLLE